MCTGNFQSTSHNSVSLPFLFPEGVILFVHSYCFCLCPWSYIFPPSLVCQSCPPSASPSALPSTVSITSYSHYSLSILLVPLNMGFCPHHSWHCCGEDYPVVRSNKHCSVLILMFGYYVSLSPGHCFSPVILATPLVAPFLPPLWTLT